MVTSAWYSNLAIITVHVHTVYTTVAVHMPCILSDDGAGTAWTHAVHHMDSIDHLRVLGSMDLTSVLY